MRRMTLYLARDAREDLSEKMTFTLGLHVRNKHPVIGKSFFRFCNGNEWSMLETQ